MQNLDIALRSSRFARSLRGLARDERGASFIEYVIVVGLVAMVCIVAFNKFGGAVNKRVDGYTDKLGNMEGAK